MKKQQGLLPALFLTLTFATAGLTEAQKIQRPMPVVRVRVDMVQLDVAVTTKKGYYVTGLSPYNFAVYEDNIRQKIATFGEENRAPRKLDEFKPRDAQPVLVQPLSGRKMTQPPEHVSSMAGASVFILFDTSNYMYRSFVFAQDSIAQFVRYLDHPDRVAFYSYSRNVSRVCELTKDRSLLASKLRTTVAGDDAALYDALLLTLKDAGKLSGQRVVVVFSNGPDNASMVSPEDVRELAQSEGIPIYIVSTRKAEDNPISSKIFTRISATTGGKAYFARHWKGQREAFASIRDDLAHLYTLSYYPRPNPNLGWRRITVKLVGKNFQKYQIRTRSGYRPQLVRNSTWTRAAGEGSETSPRTLNDK